MPPSNKPRNKATQPALDRIDHAIARALQNNARLSNKELAARVGLAPSSCLSRVRRLTARGVLRGFHAEIDPTALGIGLEALMTVRLTRHIRENFDSFRSYALTLAEVVSVYQVAGADDFLIHVAVRDADHLRDFVLDQVSTRPEVAHLETSLIFDSDHKRSLPDWADPD
jgi:DNA-binding Lrp family transcriptional regulator